jgi:hypothetical protein
MKDLSVETLFHNAGRRHEKTRLLARPGSGAFVVLEDRRDIDLTSDPLVYCSRASFHAKPVPTFASDA